MLIALVVLLGSRATHADDGVADEQLTFTARWMGMEAGQAVAERVVHDGQRQVTITARNAAWLDRLYPIDDRMVSDAALTGGATRYQTWFREGRFVQDQDMAFTDAAEDVQRRQLVDGAWRDSTSHWDNKGSRPEDPISAFYRIREADLAVGQSLGLEVYNGRHVVPVLATCVDRRTVEGAIDTARYITIRARKEGDFEGGIDLYLSDANVPLLAVLQTRAGPVRIEVR